MNFLVIGVLVGMLTLLVGCEGSQEKLIESTKAQSEIDSYNQIQAENNNTRQQSLAMENDLAARHRFFQAAKGRYEGLLQTKFGEFRIRLSLSPSLSPYDYHSHRDMRRLEEIIADLNSLTFNIQVTQWNPNNSMTAVSCHVQSIKPDMEIGEIVISDSACPNLYRIRIAQFEQDPFEDLQMSALLSQKIRDGVFDAKDSAVSVLNGEIQLSSMAEIYFFKAVKQ